MIEDEGDCIYKILLLGDSAVGKTCFLLRFTDNSFEQVHMSTIGLDYRLKTMELPNKRNVKIQIWDTAGQDKFRAITKNYYKGAHGILLIYDITDTNSFDNVKSWIEQIREETGVKVIIYLIGNKNDLVDERKIKPEDGQKIADEFGVPFFESSAKSGMNVNEIFESLVQKIDEEFSKIPDNSNIDFKKLGKNKTKKSCC